MALTPGQILHDRYQVVRIAKSGGMGSVYEAVDLKLAEMRCAVKEVLASALEGPEAAYVLRSFESEVRALSHLEHPNIPRVRDYFELAGVRYIVMDFIEGRSLDELLKLKGKLSPRVVGETILSVLETVRYLHECQPPIIHRDIKPANLILDQKGTARLVDFGIARSLAAVHTQTQVGTPGYCAPEQLAGRAEPRSDLFSVGATAYHLLSGQAPPTFSLDPLELEGIEPGLAAIVRRATQPKLADRFETAAEMAGALQSWLKNGAQYGTPKAPEPVQPEPRQPSARPSNRAIFGLVCLTAVVFGGFLGRMAAPAVPIPTAVATPETAVAVAPPPMVQLTPSPPAPPTPPATPQPFGFPPQPEHSPQPIQVQPTSRPQPNPPKPRPVQVVNPEIPGESYPQAPVETQTAIPTSTPPMNAEPEPVAAGPPTPGPSPEIPPVNGPDSLGYLQNESPGQSANKFRYSGIQANRKVLVDIQRFKPGVIPRPQITEAEFIPLGEFQRSPDEKWGFNLHHRVTLRLAYVRPGLRALVTVTPAAGVGFGIQDGALWNDVRDLLGQFP
jgi:serine/threonine protein kinase